MWTSYGSVKKHPRSRWNFLYNRGVAIRCPTCDKTGSIEGNAFRPFCSERCRLLDLNSWLTDQYRVPVDDGGVEQDSDDNVREFSGS
ncbi:MAG TPA: DNA gyrase inhibitor YacG [Nitrospirales bacterium]|nr:DNA gyrase inhibitor YacG [Nitrospirales bacterium]